MQLLIITQAVDRTDPVLGFFHRWIEEFSLRCDRVTVICLRAGDYALPSNVSVHSLGKERGVSRLSYLRNLYRLVWTLRGEYDSVFVHMNSEYVVLAGLIWRLLRKRIVLWRNHAKGGSMIRLAALLAHRLCYTSPRAFVARYRKAVQMPVGIEVDQYARERTASKGSLLWLGRLDPVKRFHFFMAALALMKEDSIPFSVDICGDPTSGREAYANDVRREFSGLEQDGTVHFLGSVRHDATPEMYRSHDIFVNLTPSGSFDKTIFEAMAAGCLVVTSNADLRDVVSHKLFIETDHVENIAAALCNALILSAEEAEKERAALRAYVRERHSLSALVDRAQTLL